MLPLQHTFGRLQCQTTDLGVELCEFLHWDHRGCHLHAARPRNETTRHRCAAVPVCIRIERADSLGVVVDVRANDERDFFDPRKLYDFGIASRHRYCKAGIGKKLT